ncbi:hypothetical protein GCM10020331_089470 [Ectobacillus funiculus]
MLFYWTLKDQKKSVPIISKNGQAELEDGSVVTISMQEVLGTASKFSVTYEGLYDDVEVGSHLLIDDGLLELEVVEKDKW